MWLSFASNILILVVGVFLYLKYEEEYAQKSWGYFVLLTGLAAGVAAFGHLDILALDTRGYLLFVSRLLNILSMLGFVKGVLDHFGHTTRGHQFANYILFSGVFIWLFYQNINYLGSKQAFIPVIVYAVIGMIVIGVPHFILALKEVKQSSFFILGGILLLTISAFIFKAIPEGSGIKPSDISHILIAFSLVSLTIGFKKTLP